MLSHGKWRENELHIYVLRQRLSSENHDSNLPTQLNIIKNGTMGQNTGNKQSYECPTSNNTPL